MMIDIQFILLRAYLAHADGALAILRMQTAHHAWACRIRAELAARQREADTLNLLKGA